MNGNLKPFERGMPDAQIDEIACRYGTMTQSGWLFRSERALRDFVRETLATEVQESRPEPCGRDCHRWVDGCDYPECTQAGAQERAAEPPALREALADLVRKALNRAWHMGQNYWADADHESISRNRRADETRAKFEALVEETCDALASPPPNSGRES